MINRLSAIHDREHDDRRLQTDRSAWETAKILDVLQQDKDRMDRGVSAMFIRIHDEEERKDADSETTEQNKRSGFCDLHNVMLSEVEASGRQ